MGAYQIPKYEPAVAVTFAFVIVSLPFLPTEGTFGSTTSPLEYELYARAWASLIEHFLRDNTLLLKHADIMYLI